MLSCVFTYVLPHSDQALKVFIPLLVFSTTVEVINWNLATILDARKRRVKELLNCENKSSDVKLL